MKKYITLAALLAAGTAFANATEIITWTELAGNKSLSASGTSIQEWELYDGTSATEKTFNADWTLVLTVDKGSFDETPLTLLAIDVRKTVQGKPNTTAENNYQGIMGLKYTYDTEAQTGTVDFTHYNRQTVTGFGISATKDITFVLSYDYTNTSTGIVSINAYADGNFDNALWATPLKSPGNQAYSSTFETLNFGGYDSAKTPGAAFTTNETAGEYKLLGAGYAMGSSTITVNELTSYYNSQVVPEPSAFGLLAGIGALALVASRRRRK